MEGSGDRSVRKVFADSVKTCAGSPYPCLFFCLFVLKKDMVAYTCTPSARGAETERSHVLTVQTTSQKAK